MLSNLRRKRIQQNIKNYSEMHINVWWSIDTGFDVFNDSNFSKQRFSNEKTKKNFEKQRFEQKRVPYYKVVNELYNMILCPSGRFTKGHAFATGNPPAEMEIEKSFLLGETEITQELYKSVMGVNPSHFKNKPKNPVENVSWYDTLIFCNKLSNIFGLDSYYTIFKDGKIIDTIEEAQGNYLVAINERSKGFRLPTEWEWEYAAKAGTDLEFSGSNIANEVGWHEDNSGSTTHPVKQKKPNAWGFYDMSGNVWEWCESELNPNIRVGRGGAFNTALMYLGLSFRGQSDPSSRSHITGFRVCRYI